MTIQYIKVHICEGLRQVHLDLGMFMFTCRQSTLMMCKHWDKFKMSLYRNIKKWGLIHYTIAYEIIRYQRLMETYLNHWFEPFLIIHHELYSDNVLWARSFMELLAQSHCNLGSMFTICFFLMLFFHWNHRTSLHADYIYYSSLIIIWFMFTYVYV